MSERDDARAGQGGQIDHAAGLVLANGVGERIGQDQAAFGVGIVDLDGLAVARADDVARPLGMSSRRVFTGGNDAYDVDGGAERGDGAEGAGDGRGAAHVELHLVHVLAGFQRDAARVERDALAHERDGARGRLVFVLQHGQRRRFHAAARDAEKRAHLELFQLVAMKDLAFAPGVFGHFQGRARQPRRRHIVGRGIGEIARPVGAFAGKPRLFTASDRGVRARLERDRDGVHLRRGRVVLPARLVLVKAVLSQQDPLDQAVRVFRQGRRVERDHLDPVGAQRGASLARRAAHGLRRARVALAETEKQDAVVRVARGRQEIRFLRFAAHQPFLAQPFERLRIRFVEQGGVAGRAVLKPRQDKRARRFRKRNLRARRNFDTHADSCLHLASAPCRSSGRGG